MAQQQEWSREDLRIIALALQRFREEWRETADGEAWFRTPEHTREIRRFVADIDHVQDRVRQLAQGQDRGGCAKRRGTCTIAGEPAGEARFQGWWWQWKLRQ